MSAIFNGQEYRAIPYFSRYLINKEGVVINITNGNRVMTPKGVSYQLSLDSGARTTRTKSGLIELGYGKEELK